MALGKVRSFRSKPVGWRGESHRHYLAAKGISTRHNVKIDEKYYAEKWKKENKALWRRPDEKGGLVGGVEINDSLFDKQKTIVHGTSLENAKKIFADKTIKAGTWPHATGGGITDASQWGANAYKEPVLIIAEMDSEPVESKWGTQWVTFIPKKGQGFPASVENRGSEREGRDDIRTETKIAKMRVLKIDKDVANKYKFDDFKEIEELRYDA